jgi:hypothetical protein
VRTHAWSEFLFGSWRPWPRFGRKEDVMFGFPGQRFMQQMRQQQQWNRAAGYYWLAKKYGLRWLHGRKRPRGTISGHELKT